MMMEERVEVVSRIEWRAWLEKNHLRNKGIWLVTYKKHWGEKHVPYEDVVEEALCFGWVDSLGRKLDDERSMLWMAPRRLGSKWSKPNKLRIAKLTAAGSMAPAGLAKVDAAKRNGAWNALDAVEALEIPPDLAEALDGYPAARGNFDAFPRSVRRGILEWIASAKKTETRARRVEETARLAEENIRANQWRG